MKGRQIIWDILLYLLAGLVIALGVIMAGPLLIFGFLVLPALAARPLVSRMSSFLLLASVLGLVMAFLGFYSSVRLDLPLGPTDVALGCCLIFLAYGLSRVYRQSRAAFLALALCSFSLSACGAGGTSPPVPEAKAIQCRTALAGQSEKQHRIAVALAVEQSAAFAGRDGRKDFCRLSPERDGSIAAKFANGVRDKAVFRFRLPEDKDARFTAFSADRDSALRVAREGKLSGAVFVSEILRWEGESQKFVRALVDFKLIRIDDGAVLWERRVQRAIPTPSATNLGQASTDAVREIVRELFAG